MAFVSHFFENIYWFFFGFLRHWYIDAPKRFFYAFLNFLQDVDRFFAWKITFSHMFQPLYGDFSFLGYIFGFVLRFCRFVVGSIAYFFIFLASLSFFVFWCVIPISLCILGVFQLFS
jgi:hypothetical protein